MTVITSSVIEIFLSQSKKLRKRQTETVDSGNTFRSVFKEIKRKATLERKKGKERNKEREDNTKVD